MSDDSIRLSASIILIREPDRSADPFEVFVLRRGEASSFMPGRYVFPGGALEVSDGEADRGGDSPAMRICALRETFEEAGVITATDPGAAAGLDPERLAGARQAVHDGRTGLVQALAGLALEPDPQTLTPYARWITPKARPKRFDAMFYLARMPEGQTPTADMSETTRGVWLSPGRALEENEAGRAALAPPQVRLMGELAGFSSTKELFSGAAASMITPVEPVLHLGDDTRTILLPWDRDHASGRPDSPARPCPAGKASRLVFTKGRWLPFTDR